MGTLKAWVDGVELPEPESRALWRSFSTWMTEHPGDLEGFARSEGFANVQPEMHGGSPALVASRTGRQRPYAAAAQRAAPAAGAAGAKKGRRRRGKPGRAR